MHRLRGSERICWFIGFLYCNACLFLCKVRKKEGSYVAFFSFSSNLSLLNGMSYGRTWHRLTSATYCPRRSRWFYLSPAIFLSSRRRRRRPAHAFCLKALLSSCLHCHSFLLWVWLTLFQEKNEETRRVYYFLLFLLPRLAWGYHTDTFALICTWYNEPVPVSLENEPI